MDLFGAALLGVVQGLTEFLPVSSSGHLILARAFFGWDAARFGLAFDVAVHVGTLLAILVYFWRDVVQMILALPGALGGGQGEHERLVRLIAAGTIPIVIVGLLFADWLEGIRSPAVVAATLAVGGVGLVVAERLGRKSRDARVLSYVEAFAIGVAQTTALIPGVSRSGATLTVALLLGLRREGAARFVFLLSLPAVLAAAAREVLKLTEAGAAGIPVMLFAVGLVTSAVVGYLTIKYFLRYLANHSLAAFAYYRFALAAVTLLWLLTRGGAGA
ncbi:MAG TPA: undecaprenyl-diphosphatase UppP [Vicinamibacterales bacterium]|nr:undecaprenyl-diphosphatase UppP [Vicinamibacterales bacterium]